jgi:hypothetical protein
MITLSTADRHLRKERRGNLELLDDKAKSALKE